MLVNLRRPWRYENVSLTRVVVCCTSVVFPGGGCGRSAAASGGPGGGKERGCGGKPSGEPWRRWGGAPGGVPPPGNESAEGRPLKGAGGRGFSGAGIREHDHLVAPKGKRSTLLSQHAD